MLDIYAQALRVAPLPDVGGSEPIVVAFGSFGRLDGATNISDYDIMFLYPGPANAAAVASIRELIREVISSNKALMFDHRAAIEAKTFDFETSPAYPILAMSELADPRAETRALQTLTEGRCVLQHEPFTYMASDLIKKFGHTENVHSFDLRPLREAMMRLKSGYCTGVFGRRKADPKLLTNRKVLKLFALREFSYLANLFAAADIAVATSARVCPPSQAVRILASPSVLKIACFSEPSGDLATLINSVDPKVRHIAAETAKGYAARVPEPIRKRLTEPVVDVGDGELIPNLRVLSLNVLRSFDGLLQLLHDPAFLQVIDGFEPDITTWIAAPQFSRVLERRRHLIDACRLLAACLSDILAQVGHCTGCPVLEDAKRSLNMIKEYTLELDLPRPV